MARQRSTTARHSTKNVPWRGWKGPGTHERTVMRKKCGSKCFLGPKTCNCFPICNPGTCKINNKGIWAAYVRAREYGSSQMHSRGNRHTKKTYQKIASKARTALKKRKLM